MFTLLLALRNQLRNSRRSLLAISAIMFGVIALLLSEGFIDWIFWAMRDSYIHSQLGHIQVTRSGYTEQGTADPFNYLLPETTPIQKIIMSDPHVEVLAPRLYISGLISHGDNTVSFIGQGVDPDTEKELSKNVIVSEGKDLTTDMPNGLTMGRGLAKNLGVSPGDSVVLLVNTPSGSLNAIEATVSGLFYSSIKTFDDTALRLPIVTARSLLRVSGAHAWLLLLDKTDQTTDTLQRLRNSLGADSGLELTPWYELSDFYQKTVALFSKQVHVVRIIIALIIVTSISNLLIMSVLERTGEIGTLMAIGIKRSRILWMFISEGLLLGIIGGIIGVILGFILASVISYIGIPMPPPPGMDVGFIGEILLTPTIAINAFVLGLVTTVLASIYPARKASRMEIVNALRHNR